VKNSKTTAATRKGEVKPPPDTTPAGEGIAGSACDPFDHQHVVTAGA
jgi:hypothetical protein